MTDQHVEPGFEIQGEFYPWAVSDTGKDLLLIDRFTGIPVDQFFDLIKDEDQLTRAPIILAMMATSIRAQHDWSVERIVKLLLDTPLSEVTMIEGDQEVQTEDPPAQGGEEPPTSTSPVEESSPSLTPEEASNFATLYGIQR